MANSFHMREELATVSTNEKFGNYLLRRSVRAKRSAEMKMPSNFRAGGHSFTEKHALKAEYVLLYKLFFANLAKAHVQFGPPSTWANPTHVSPVGNFSLQ